MTLPLLEKNPNVS